MIELLAGLVVLAWITSMGFVGIQVWDDEEDKDLAIRISRTILAASLGPIALFILST